MIKVLIFCLKTLAKPTKVNVMVWAIWALVIAGNFSNWMGWRYIQIGCMLLLCGISFYMAATFNRRLKEAEEERERKQAGKILAR